MEKKKIWSLVNKKKIIISNKQLHISKNKNDVIKIIYLMLIKLFF